MTTASEYRQFATECLRWAAEAETEDDREAFLQLAHDWTLAALRIEGVLVPDSAPTEAPAEQRP
jgi:hypothetical protein